MVNTILEVAVAIILLSIGLTMIRFVKGKTSVDRVIAFDVMSVASLATNSNLVLWLPKERYILMWQL